MQEETQLLTVKEAATFLRLGRTKVYELCRKNDLPIVRLGKTIRIPKSGLVNYIDSNTRQAKRITQ